MRIRFSLAWLKPLPGRQARPRFSGGQAGAQTLSKAFKSKAAGSLLAEYLERISRFAPCEVGNIKFPRACRGHETLACEVGNIKFPRACRGHETPACEAGTYPSRKKSCVWICERQKGSKAMSSEDLARALQACMNAGTQELEVVIGGPDGFTMQELEAMKPALRWSFGPMTLPHELAAVVAAEQIYRAFTILKNLPYHSGH